MAIAAPPSTYIVLLAIVPLAVWRMYSRVRRMIGRQPFVRARALATTILFPLITVMVAVPSVPMVWNDAGLFAGILLGVLLGRYGLRVTRFETTPEGLFYTPSAHLGIGLSLLFIGRIVYRLVQLSLLDLSVAQAPASSLNSPLTLALFGTMAGYYVTYALGLLSKARSK